MCHCNEDCLSEDARDYKPAKESLGGGNEELNSLISSCGISQVSDATGLMVKVANLINEKDDRIKDLESQLESHVAVSNSSQITLGDLIYKLERVPKEGYAVHLNGKASVSIHSPHSYGGYYEQLAFEEVVGPLPLVHDVLEMLKSCVGNTYIGYKGGAFTMRNRTFIWVSAYGSASDVAICGILVNKEKRIVTLLTKIEE